MIDEIKKLENSIESNQYQLIRSALGDNLFKILDDAFDAENEDEASAKIKDFAKSLKAEPLKALRLRNILNKEQMKIIMELWRISDGQ